MLHRVDQVSMGDHGMMGRLVELPGTMEFRGATLMLCGMLQQFRRFQMMINALLRHALSITSSLVARQLSWFARLSSMACNPKLLRDIPIFALLDDEEMAVLAGQVELVT